KNLFRKRDSLEFKFNASIRTWLGLDALSTDKEINSIIGSYLELLVRRIFFLHSLSEEKYLSNWLDYFAASSNINPGYLVRSQIWLSCGMLVEWIFNFVAFGLNAQQKSITPGNRKLDTIIPIQNFLGTEAFMLGFTGYSGIWDRRDKRSDLKDKKSPEQAIKETFEIVRDTLKFVNLINLDLTPTISNTFPFETVLTLRKNLEQSKKNAVRRQELDKKLSDLRKRKEQYDAVDYQFKKKDLLNLDELNTKISTFDNELNDFSNAPLLKVRHSLLAHLLKL
ncbi:MAG TPA: hypothetical protein VK308_04155, partial [Pyrinomonadaceae bacterium]|nr:hypothetical protein [Pyrinomonadaceae bacterium]